MWSFKSGCLGGKLEDLKNAGKRTNNPSPDCSDDEVSSCTDKEESLECPICWESFNIVENVPYVLWCGHTLCKNCVLGLQWAVVKSPTVPIQLPFFISCPWCNLLSFRLIYKGNLTFPRKNYFLLWMVESMNCDRAKSVNSVQEENHRIWPQNGSSLSGNNSSHNQNTTRAPHLLEDRSSLNHSQAGQLASHFSSERIQISIRRSVSFFIQLMAKFPLLIIFCLIVLYAVPASAAILILYIIISILFALPSFLILYFAYPSLDWLFREIFT